MVPLLLELEFSPGVKAMALVSAIGWIDRDRSLSIALAPNSLSPGPITLVVSEDMADDVMGELVDSDNDRVALVTGIQGVDRLDKLLFQSLDRFIASEPAAPTPPPLPPIPAYSTR